MGFLDKLFNEETRKIISNVVENVVDNVVDTINDSMNSNHSSSDTQNMNSKNPDEEDCYNNEAVVRERIERIATTEWSDYELRRDIPAVDMGASVEARGYSYGLYLNGIPKAMIIIIDTPSHYKKKDVLLAHQACKNQQVFCMNLLLHLPNRYSYISKQLRDNVAR